MPPVAFLHPENAPKSLATGASPQTPLGSLQRCPSSWIKGPTSKGRGWEVREGRGDEGLWTLTMLETDWGPCPYLIVNWIKMRAVLRPKVQRNELRSFTYQSDAHAVLAQCFAGRCRPKWRSDCLYLHQIDFPKGSVAAVCRWGG